jgi:hypothetical protein
MADMRRGAVPALAAAALAAAAGCGGKSAGAPPGTTVGGVRVAKTFVVHETESRLSPTRILIPRLTYYGFKAVNDGTETHALALAGPGIHVQTKEIAPGGSATFSAFFKRSGKYTLFDPLDDNRAKGMEATVTAP